MASSDVLVEVLFRIFQIPVKGLVVDLGVLGTRGLALSAGETTGTEVLPRVITGKDDGAAVSFTGVDEPLP